MNFRTTATLAAACLFASAGVARAQAPASVSTQATAPAGKEERNSLHAPATAGDAQAQFALGNYYFQTRYVGLDYAQALAWYRASAAQGFAPAQDQLGSMYKNHIGLPRSAGQGNIHGKRNVEDFTSELEEQGDGAWQNATAPVHDPVFDQAQRWANVQDLHGRIDAVESDALYQEDLASQLEHMGKGKNDGISKVFHAMGSVGATKYHIQAERDRDEAARLRDELARIESQRQTVADDRTP